ncbi:hypothetical protein KKB64_00040 [Patescibacteria group bacterium]|nr:hypothetical protein [Patescibacteria group bacterium]MBU1472164.1 hypothetical protein [Patescibacteria group bacterium]MBU2459558.1 hypothetical protein [Patescibacteria group bacterium]MBU2544201.1 hypothetical protein [Patescibacteria group bacterium]
MKIIAIIPAMRDPDDGCLARAVKSVVQAGSSIRFAASVIPLKCINTGPVLTSGKTFKKNMQKSTGIYD